MGRVCIVWQDVIAESAGKGYNNLPLFGEKNDYISQRETHKNVTKPHR